MHTLQIIAALPASYTFTSNARAATFGITASGNLDFKAVSNKAGGSSVKFMRKAPVRIVRARLIPSGAPGLQAGMGKLAATLQLAFTDASGSIPAFSLSLARWGEWEDKNISLPMGQGGPCELSIAETDTEFSCDDFNLQEEFIGQDVEPVLELEVESDSIVDAVTGEGF